MRGVEHGLSEDDFKVFIAWMLCMNILFVVYLVAFRVLGVLSFPTRKGARTSDVVAFLIVAGLSVGYMALSGFIAQFGWFGTNVDNLFSGTIEESYYANNIFVRNHLVVPMVAYQIWNLAAGLLFSDLGGIEMLLHHIATGSLAYFGLHPYIQNKAIFFFGIAEFTNVPL